MLQIIWFLGPGSLLMLDLMSDDPVTGYATIFWQENTKNYNLLLANRKILNIYITYLVYVVEMFIEDVKFAVPRPHNQTHRHFFAGKYENTLIYL